MCFIFPNKRAVSFFRKYMGEECAAAKKAMISPECLTINDFFARIGGLRPADRMESLVTLYDCYSKLYPNAETLDEFIFWGGVLQSDFAEVDKYLVKADHIFKNVAEFRQMQDDLSYLEPEQREAMESFLGQFKGSGDYKEKFRRIWDILLPLYHSFNDALASKGLASEGMLYRSIADRLESESAVDVLAGSFPDSEKFVFVGLNALNECEKKVLRKMRDAHLAEFCWDFSSKEIKDPANRSSFFLAQNVAEFPQAFGLDPDGLPRPVVNVVSVPSSVGQTKLLPYILSAPDQDTPSLTAAQPAFAGCSAPPIAGDGPLPLSRGWRRSWEGIPPVSVDTTSAEIVRRVYGRIGRFIVNDISAGEDAPRMLPTVAELGLPYIAMHKRGNPRSMDSLTDYPQGVVAAVDGYFRDFAARAEELGVSEWILDPGFGFAKSAEQNWELLENLPAFRHFGRPILVGVADKRFTRTPNPFAAEGPASGSAYAERLAGERGADILRIH